MMKTGEAFAAFIDWDLTELLRENPPSPDDLYSCVRKLDDIVTTESKESAPDRVDWVMDAHRIVWFKKGRSECDLVWGILSFFYRLLVKTRNNAPPQIVFKAGVGMGQVAMHQVNKNVLFGKGLEDASACSKIARNVGLLMVVNPSMLHCIRTDIAEQLPRVHGSGNPEMVSVDEKQLAKLVFKDDADNLV